MTKRTAGIVAGLLLVAAGSSGFAQDAWEPRAPMSMPRGLLAVQAPGNGKIYAIGGWYPGVGSLIVNQEYDPASDTWATKANLPTSRLAPASASWNGFVYVIGGWGDGSTFPTNERYDPVTNSWTTQAPMPTARHRACASVAAGKIYVMGGYLGGGGITLTQAYDPSTNTWTTKSPMPEGRFSAAAETASNGKIYVLGGADGSGEAPMYCITEALEYDPASDVWNLNVPMQLGRGGVAAGTGPNGKIYVTGGYGNDSSSQAAWLKHHEAYDPVTGGWQYMTNMPTARRELGAAAVDGKIYYIGGAIGLSGGSNIGLPDPTPVATNERYTPPTGDNSPSNPPPTLWLSPTVLELTAAQGGLNPPPQPLYVTNGGGGTLNFAVLTNESNFQPWMTVTPLSGSVPAGGSQELTLTVNIAGLQAMPGYFGSVAVVPTVDATNFNGVCWVTLNVTPPAPPPASITLSTTSLSFTATAGTNPAPQAFSISNPGGSTLNWTATSSEPWLTLSPAGSEVAAGSSTPVLVSVAAAALDPGSYPCTITISDPAASNSLATVDVSLTVADPPPPPPPVISLAPETLPFTAVSGGADPEPQSFTITNTGGSTLNWALSDSAAWLTASPPEGSLAPEASATVSVGVGISGLAPDVYLAMITVSDPAASNNPQAISVSLTLDDPPPPPPPVISLAPETLPFTAVSGGADPEPQSLTITNAGGSTLNWTLSASATWLSAGPTTGTVEPGASATVSVGVSVAGLAPDVYLATITVSDLAALASPQAISVNLTVSAPPPPVISLSDTTLSFAAIAGGSDPAPQSLMITNTGGSTLNWTLSTSEAWLSVSPTTAGTLAPSASTTLSMSASITGLAANTYSAAITVSGTGAVNSPQEVAVTLVVSPVPVPFLSISPNSFAFTATQDGADPEPQTLTISNLFGGVLSWTAASDAEWLSVAPTTGSVPLQGSQPLTLSIAVAGLPAGTHTATVTVSDPAALNSPQVADVTLTVEPAPVSPAEISLSPATLSLTAISGGLDPAAQSLTITNTGGSTLNWTLTENEPWLSASPETGTLAPGASATVSVSASITGLAANTYSATITVSDPAASNSPQSVTVNLTVDPAITNTPPEPPTAMGQFRSDGTTAIAVGGLTNEATVVFRATLDDPGDMVRLQVEIVPQGIPWAGVPTATSTPPVPSGSTVSVAVSGLANTPHLWRARAMDSQDQTGAWVLYGGTPSFVVEVSAPNQPPGTPTAQAQYRLDGVTAIAAGGTTSETGVILSAAGSDPDGGPLTLQFELQPAGVAFAGSPTQSAAALSGAVADVPANGLPAGEYHWRVRSMDPLGATSAWSAEMAFKVVPAAANTPPGVPTGLTQWWLDGITSLAPGATTPESGVILAAIVTDPDGDLVRLEVEVRPLLNALAGTPTAASILSSSGATATVIAQTVTPGAFHWQARAVDALGTASPWVEFGPQDPDFLHGSTNEPPALLWHEQFALDGLAILPPGGTTSEPGVVFKALADDPEAGAVSYEFELKPETMAFDGIATTSTGALPTGILASLPVTGLSAGSYHWRVRAIDGGGLDSPWTSPVTFAVTPAPANQAPFPPGLLRQYRLDAVTLIPAGGRTREPGILLAGIVSDPDSSVATLEVELKPLAEPMTGGGIVTSLPVVAGGTAWVEIAGLPEGAYHWRARSVDPAGAASDWVEFAGEGAPDFLRGGNAPPDAPASLSQFLVNGGLVVQGQVRDPDGDAVRLEVEVQPTGQAFADVPLAASPLAESRGFAVVSVSGLPKGNHRWQARALDEFGAASAWVVYPADPAFSTGGQETPAHGSNAPAPSSDVTAPTTNATVPDRPMTASDARPRGTPDPLDGSSGPTSCAARNGPSAGWFVLCLLGLALASAVAFRQDGPARSFVPLTDNELDVLIEMLESSDSVELPNPEPAAASETRQRSGDEVPRSK